ncbi:MAG: hypothetical protein JSS86_21555, partial [Cyanobacteria bacterium SZAS LIN-2]|nr:hypothetical protein [Cyanobacteria bacterium SZAS LIN-2]
GFDVNAQNLAGEKNHILQRMGEISQDPSRSDQDRAVAERVVRTNEAIDRVQSHGVDVVQAAGNTGADRFSWDFMNANKQLSSARPSGRADDFSADHSLATKGDGVVPVTLDKNPNMLDSRPIKEQAGTLELGDSGVKFPATGQAAFQGNTSLFDREKIKPEYSQPRVVTSTVEATSAELKPELTMSKQPDAAPQLGDTAALPSNKFSGPTMDGHWTKAFPITDENRGLFSTPKDGQKLVTGYVDGTSFVNMQYFKENMARMAQEKAAR